MCVLLENALIVIVTKSLSLFHYTRCNTPERVTSWRGPSPRHCARATQLLSKKCRNGGEPLATVSDLTGPRFEPQTSRSRDERVTARPIGRFSYKVIITKIKQGTAFSTYKCYFIATKPSKLRL